MQHIPSGKSASSRGLRSSCLYTVPVSCFWDLLLLRQLMHLPIALLCNLKVLYFRRLVAYYSKNYILYVYQIGYSRRLLFDNNTFDTIRAIGSASRWEQAHRPFQIHLQRTKSNLLRQITSKKTYIRPFKMQMALYQSNYS